MNFPLFNFVCSDPSLIYRMLAVSATVPKAAADVAGIHIYMFVWFVGSFVVVVVGGGGGGFLLYFYAHLSTYYVWYISYFDIISLPPLFPSTFYSCRTTRLMVKK